MCKKILKITSAILSDSLERLNSIGSYPGQYGYVK